MIFDLPFAHFLVILSTIIMLVGGYAYLRDTLLGKTRPNRVSWFMWALAPLISVGAALAADADIWATVRVIVGGIIPLIVFSASFVNRHSYWKLSRFDLICGALSLLALIFWSVADSPVAAIILATAGNTFASIPTMFKAWHFPETETKLTFTTSFVSAALILPAIPEWNIENAAFQIMLLVTTGILLFTVYRQKLGFSGLAVK